MDAKPINVGTCSQCWYSGPGPEGHITCRRLSPSREELIHLPDGTYYNLGQFPIMRADDFCGELEFPPAVAKPRPQE